LISRDARRRFEAAYFVDLHALITDTPGNALENILGEVLRRRLKFIEGRKLVDISVIKVLHDLICGGFSLFENGEMAIALATNVRIDLILMDTDLPVVDGYAATSRIREYTPTHEIPIVMMSGHAEPAAQMRAFAAGCTEYLVKPFSLHGFDSMVNRYLYADKAKLARAV